ncbi:hypothetical protein BKA57DRAFT_506918 [Linnemannia elongata]|nr:hypothetical protein BKA57DRAFT_506918 [Linnemannia elongata]
MSNSPTANHSAEKRHNSTTQSPVVNGQTTISKAPPTRELSRLSIINTFTFKKEMVDPKKQYKSVPHVVDNYCEKCQFRFVLGWCDDCESCLLCCPDYVPLIQSLPGLHDADEPPSYGI